METLSSPLVEALADIVGGAYVRTAPDELTDYSCDQTLDWRFPFAAVVLPGTAGETAAVLGLCDRYRIPVTPRGGGSGVTGGALPLMGGVVLSTERLCRIIEINEADRYVVAEAGVVTDDLCRAVAEKGFYFPLAPSSSAFSFVGGNVAENAGSIRSCKYGSTADQLLNLEVALPSGELIWTGANVRKNATGIHLTSLFAGSEGLLGVITKVVYRLSPTLPFTANLLAGFGDLGLACETVVSLGRLLPAPSAVELICRNAIELTTAWLGSSQPLPAGRPEALLLIECQEPSRMLLDHAIQQAGDILEKHGAGDILVGESVAERATLGELRFNIGNAMTSGGNTYRDIDAVIPVSRLYDYISYVGSVCAESDIPLVCFGHALDGNLHTMLLTGQQGAVRQDTAPVVKKIYEYVVEAGGTLSGEHGIGMLQKAFMPLQFSATQLDIMRGIKRIFDPNGILNPGKML